MAVYIYERKRFRSYIKDYINSELDLFIFLHANGVVSPFCFFECVCNELNVSMQKCFY